MDNAITGVRYIGKKDVQEDTVCKTGAVWTSGQVHNFAGGLAKRLLAHTDSFEAAEISMDGQTFMSSGKAKTRDAAPYVNLSAMTEDQLVHLARFEFNRVVNPSGKSVEQLRQEVQGLMVSHSLDMIEDEHKAGDDNNYRIPVIYQATPEEHAALKAGALVLALVTVADEPSDELVAPADDPAPEYQVPLDLEAMTKDELVALAKDRFGADIDKRKSVEAIRAKVSELLDTDRAA